MTDSSTKTVRILSLDGGGMRGYMSATFLNRFCTESQIDPAKLSETFDIISGTSIGGIQALGYAYGQTPQNLLDFFSVKGSEIFYYDSVFSLSTYKFNVMTGLYSYPNTFYCSQSPNPLKVALQSVFNTKTLKDLKTKVLIPAWDAGNDVPIIYSNITDPQFSDFLSTADAPLVDVGLATSAAPIYFPPAIVNGLTMIDGGVYQNNPVTTAYAVAKKLYPNARRFCVLSLGTGASHNTYVPYVPPSLGLPPAIEDPIQAELREGIRRLKEELKRKYPEQKEKIEILSQRVDLSAPDNVQYLLYLMDNVFIPGPQNLASKTMELESQDLFDDIFYYRFQYQFQEGQDSSLDNYAPSNLSNLATYANSTYDADSPKIQNFIGHLLA